MDYKFAAQLVSGKVLLDLVSEERGLTDAEAGNRLHKFGENKVSIGGSSVLDILKRQFSSPFIYLLLGAGVVALTLGETLDGGLIFLFVLINTILGFFQEYRSEQTAKLLKNYLVRTTTVLRGGEIQEVDIHNVVTGDVLSLEPGDIIPADARLLSCEGLIVDESVLTGESVPVNKTVDTIDPPSSEQEAKNIVFTGCHVVGGKAHAVVFATGRDTSFGKIARLATSTSRASGYEKDISQFSKFILILVVTTIAGVFLANIFIKHDANIPDLLIFSIALAVSVIPEAMPVVTTFSLSIGALKLAKNNVIVKRLSAIEDLGSIQVLCSDKTGTLTENKLSVSDVYVHGSNTRQQVLSYALVTSPEGKDKGRQVYDTAIHKALGGSFKAEGTEHLQEIPFDPNTRKSAVLVKWGKTNKLIVRGALEVVLRTCSLSASSRTKLSHWAQDQEKSGSRVLLICAKNTKHSRINLGNEKKGMKLIGGISFSDPIKPSVRDSIQMARKLNIEVKILTGDSAIVAGAVAQEIGLIESSQFVLTGDEFENMSVSQQHKAVNEYSVFARVTPEQKYKIISLIKETKRVGFLGEGINDAPALKISDVGLVVKEASDIASEASDIILLKKSLKVIIDGVVEGRKVFANTTKYITATLASNFGNFFAVASASLLVPFLPLLPVQILLLNLLSDFPMVSVATDNVDANVLSSPRGYDMKDIIVSASVLGMVSTVFDFIFFGIFQSQGPAILHAAWFMGSTLTELVFIYSIRTKGLFWRAKAPSRALVGLTVVAAAAAVLLPLSTIGQNIFKFGSLRIDNIALVLAIVVAYFVVTEIMKLSYNKFIYSSRYAQTNTSPETRRPKKQR